MKIVGGGIACGKTTIIIKQCAEEGGFIVCENRQAARSIVDAARELGLTINFPITFDDFENKHYHPEGVEKFHIDNADLLLERMTKVPIETISVQGPIKKMMTEENAHLHEDYIKNLREIKDEDWINRYVKGEWT